VPTFSDEEDGSGRLPGPHAMTSKQFYRLLAVLTLVAILFAGVLFVRGSGEDPAPVAYVWKAPSTGSPVAFYRVQLSLNDGAFTAIGTTTTTSYSVPIEWGNKYVIRIAGVDATGHQGPYSLPSVAYTPELPQPSPYSASDIERHGQGRL
jgi:hypothetical protein